MKILFTADLHLNVAAPEIQDQLAKVLSEENPSILVIAGDLTTVAKINLLDELLRHLIRIKQDIPVAIALGNHDFWIDLDEQVSPNVWPSLNSIIDYFWVPAAASNRMTLLDRDNLNLGSHALVGGYGHYDFGFAIPDLEIDGIKITENHYLQGGLQDCVWNDFIRIPRIRENLHREAKMQAEGLAERMDRAIATGKRLLLALHTLPFPELNGHPFQGGKQRDMFTAYGGNSLVGKEVANRAKHIDFLVCGHTHKHVPEQVIHGVRCVNVGADYGFFRGVIFDTDGGTSRMVGHPVDGLGTKSKLRRVI